MFLAYLDESGDSGIDGSPTRFFVLSCVLVHESAWLDSLDSLIALRRALRETYDIPTRPEIKARHFHNGRGPLRHLRWSQADRMELFRRVLCQVGDSLNFRVFGIAIDKVPARKRGWETRMAAWTFALQRIERFTVEPVRASQDSYFVQLADWAAYAAHRSSHIAPIAGVPEDLWREFGPSLLLQVNRLAGGPPGLVLYSP